MYEQLLFLRTTSLGAGSSQGLRLKRNLEITKEPIGKLFAKNRL